MKITSSAKKISNKVKSIVNVESEKAMIAFTAKATKVGDLYGRGYGYDLISDDAGAIDGIVYFEEPVFSFQFDIESSELFYTEGEYRISIYAKYENGQWSDEYSYYILYTSKNKIVIDQEGRQVLALQEAGNGKESYTSKYTGRQIDDFISRILKDCCQLYDSGGSSVSLSGENILIRKTTEDQKDFTSRYNIDEINNFIEKTQEVFGI